MNAGGDTRTGLQERIVREIAYEYQEELIRRKDCYRMLPIDALLQARILQHGCSHDVLSSTYR